MSSEELRQRLLASLADPLPLPAAGNTSERHRRLMELGREDLSLARLAEAHWDAVAILAEAGRTPQTQSLYGVWAAEKPGMELLLAPVADGYVLSGTKIFCSGAGIVDCALVTTGPAPRLLVEVDLAANQAGITFDNTAWKSAAFKATGTSTAHFENVQVPKGSVLGADGWYTSRPGFWRGACGPAACWAGGAAGLAEYSLRQSRRDPHSVAHLGAMQAAVWALSACLKAAGNAIDQHGANKVDGVSNGADATNREMHILALTLRHLVEQTSTEVLRRLPRAYGPHPLAFDAHISQQYQELDLYLRQSHAERDLESLGRAILDREQLAGIQQS